MYENNQECPRHEPESCLVEHAHRNCAFHLLEPQTTL